jgi:hypothetical protein
VIKKGARGEQGTDERLGTRTGESRAREAFIFLARPSLSSPSLQSSYLARHQCHRIFICDSISSFIIQSASLLHRVHTVYYSRDLKMKIGTGCGILPMCTLSSTFFLFKGFSWVL